MAANTSRNGLVNGLTHPSQQYTPGDNGGRFVAIGETTWRPGTKPPDGWFMSTAHSTALHHIAGTNPRTGYQLPKFAAANPVTIIPNSKPSG